MGAREAIKLLEEDHGGQESKFWADFSQDRPIKSFLQRNEKTLEEMLEMFDWQDDDGEWSAEYDKVGECDEQKLIQLRRRVYFLVCAWRELKEDFGRGDVSCLREIRTPMVTCRTPLKAMEDEFNGGE